MRFMLGLVSLLSFVVGCGEDGSPTSPGDGSTVSDGASPDAREELRDAGRSIDAAEANADGEVVDAIALDDAGDVTPDARTSDDAGDVTPDARTSDDAGVVTPDARTSDDAGDVTPDARTSDASSTDDAGAAADAASTLDAASSDMGPADAGVSDAGERDAAEPTDAGTAADSSALDGAASDATPADATTPDATMVDAASTDAAVGAPSWVRTGGIGAGVIDFALASDATRPYAVVVQDEIVRRVRVLRWDGLGWAGLPDIDLAVDVNTRSVALALDAGRLVVAYPTGSSNVEVVSCSSEGGDCIVSHVGIGCVAVRDVRVAAAGGRAEVAAVGAGGCGIGVAHASIDIFTGTITELTDPGATAEGLLPWQSAGGADVAAAGPGAARVALPAQAAGGGVEALRVVRWVPGAGWSALGGDVRSAPFACRLPGAGFGTPGCDVRLTLEAGSLRVLWNEVEGGNLVLRLAHLEAGAWALDPAPDDAVGRPTAPSIAGSVIAWEDRASSPVVVRSSERTASGWRALPELSDAALDVTSPDVVIASGETWLGHLRGPEGSAALDLRVLR